MRPLKRNKQKLYYALPICKVPIYEYRKRSDGSKERLDTGEKETLYSEPIGFSANISMSGSEAEAKEYGLSIADYEAIIVIKKGQISLVEGALIWHESPVMYKYDEEIEFETSNGIITTKMPDKVSADYVVMKCPDSLNVTKAILKAVNK